MRFAIALVGLLGSACVSYRGSAVVVDPPILQPGLVLVANAEFEAQSGDIDCGPTALRVALRRLGAEVPVEAIPLGDDGATMQSLRDAARSVGCQAFVVRGTLADFGNHLAKGRSLVVGMHKPFTDGVHRHYEVVVGFHARDQYVLTVDPARGFTRIDVPGFLAEWEPAGCPLLLIAPATGQ